MPTLQALMLFLLVVITSGSKAQLSSVKLPLVPMPAEVRMGSGNFKFFQETQIIFNDENFLSDADIFKSYLESMYGLNLKIRQSSQIKNNQLTILLDEKRAKDSYALNIDSTGIVIYAGKGAGAFYALQTLIQLLPAGKVKELKVPSVYINDQPRFSYRGMHLDVARHFFPVAFIKKYIDYLALYKMNMFHWHLTDDQGWRIEIKKYPRLQTVSAWRKGTRIGHLHDEPEIFDTILYGGYYTQDQVKEVISYAGKRHITVIPEIEMPGHALAALAAYPEYSCTGGPFEVGRTWGVFKDVFCPKESTFSFLQDVLDEVCELFPGPYVHIGGDECPKDRWKECSDCQALMKKENLTDEHSLQGYFTNRIVSYLKTKNKRAIGWDEILEPGLDASAIVMSWRGYQGGANAAVKGHDVIMAPHTHCYFDMYQSRNTDGRMAIGGFLPLDQVYRFEPVPDVLKEEQAKHILGAQGNVWTEYIKTEERLQEMIFPRMSALAEVLWVQRESRDYNAFTSRLLSHFKLLGFLKINYSSALFDISTRVFPKGNEGLSIELLTQYPRGKIYYSLDGTEPGLSSTLYTDKIFVDQSVTIKAQLIEGIRKQGNVFSQSYIINKSTGKEIILKNPPHEEYSRGGAFSLVNGLTGNLPWIASEWLGFKGTDLEATIDLGSMQTILRVYVDVLNDEAGKIFLPKEVEIFLSNDGHDFQKVASIDSSDIQKMNRKLRIDVPSQQARWIKVIARNSNGKDWLLVDEIGVE